MKELSVGRLLFFSVLVLPFFSVAQEKDRGDYSTHLTSVYQSNFEMGMKAGLNQTLFQFDPPSVIANSTLNKELGTGLINRLSLKFGSNKGFAFLSEPGYLQKQSKINLPGDTTFTLTYNMQYVSIPIMGSYQSEFQYFFGNIFQQFYVNFGLNLNILAKSRRKTEIEGVDFSQSTAITGKTHTLEGSFVVAIGSRFLVSETGSFYLELKGNNGMSNINQSLDLFSSTTASGPDIEINHFGASFLIGFTTSVTSNNSANDY